MFVSLFFNFETFHIDFSINATTILLPYLSNITLHAKDSFCLTFLLLNVVLPTIGGGFNNTFTKEHKSFSGVTTSLMASFKES